MGSNAFIVRVHEVPDANHVVVEAPNGNYFPILVDAGDEFKVGEVLSFWPDDDTYAKAPSDSWISRFRVGVVRNVGGGRAVVSNQGSLIDCTFDAALAVQDGNTVRIDPQDRIVEIVNGHEILPDAIRIDREDGFDPRVFVQITDAKSMSWNDFGGMESIVEQAREIVDVHLKNRHKIVKLGAVPVRGVLFEGPSGSGKTHLARIMAQQAGAVLYVVEATQLGGRLVGESEARLQRVYDHAAMQDQAIVFIDEIDAITRQRGNGDGSHADRLVSTFLVNMDGFNRKDNVLTIGTTNRVSDVDIALRRPGRFGLEVAFRAPDRGDRLAILKVGMRRMKVEATLDVESLVDRTEGWTAAELDSVWTEAATFAVRAGLKRVTEEALAVGFEKVSRHRGAKVIAP
jgi:transitional endoplasmic reticulum ATPase